MMMKHYILPLRKIGEIRLILIALSFMMCAMIFCIFEAGACAERRKDFMIVPFCETIDTNMMCKYPMLELTNYFETSDFEYAGI